MQLLSIKARLTAAGVVRCGAGGQRDLRWAPFESPTRCPADVDFELTYKLQLPPLVGVAVQWDVVRSQQLGAAPG